MSSRMQLNPKFFPSGDSGLLINLDEEIDPSISREIYLLADSILREKIGGVSDIVPGYCSLLILYDPLRNDYRNLVSRVKRLMMNLGESGSSATRRVEIPTCYGGDYGPDLLDVAALHGLSGDEVIRIHSSIDYFVYFIGFCPGFPYMGKVPSSIATPRLAKPRVRVPAGSVGIAGNQTGIYPIETPGGWRLIGRTPLKLFDPNLHPPNLLWPGDTVRFVPISPFEFQTIRSDVEAGRFHLRIADEKAA